jgi:ppGpp synthetase/RelA/SpoT-type nucleotidyltranferase
VAHLCAIEEGVESAPSQEELEAAIKVIEGWRHAHARPLSRVASNLRHYVAAERKPWVTQRLKKFPTIADKLVREPKMKLSRMADIGGVRALLPDQEAAYRIASRLRRNWTIIRFRDYVAKPKADGYRALHLISRHRGQLIEIQLRTPLQDNWANMVEILARLGAPDLKYGGGPEHLREFLCVSSEITALKEQGMPIDPSLQERHWVLGREADTFVDEADEPR